MRAGLGTKSQDKVLATESRLLHPLIRTGQEDLSPFRPGGVEYQSGRVAYGELTERAFSNLPLSVVPKGLNESSQV